MWHLHRILLAGVFIGNVVANRAVLVEILHPAPLHVLHLRRLRAFDVVADNRTAKDADHGSRRLASATANRISHGAARDGAHDGTGARLGLLHNRLLGVADLPRNSNLLNDRGGGNNSGPFLLGERHSA